MKGIKMTPTLAKALAARVVERIREENNIKNNLLREKIEKTKEYKRLVETEKLIKDLQNEQTSIKDYIKKTYDNVASISKNYPGNEYSISFSNGWYDQEVIKNQILLNGTFTTDSVDQLVEGAVNANLKK